MNLKNELKWVYSRSRDPRLYNLMTVIGFCVPKHRHLMAVSNLTKKFNFTQNEPDLFRWQKHEATFLSFQPF